MPYNQLGQYFYTVGNIAPQYPHNINSYVYDPPSILIYGDTNNNGAFSAAEFADYFPNFSDGAWGRVVRENYGGYEDLNPTRGIDSQEEYARAASTFDAQYYLTHNPDVALAVNNSEQGALNHFITFGDMEGRSPNAQFNPQEYLALNPDVSEAIAQGTFGGSAFDHYLAFGLQEKRTVSAAHGALPSQNDLLNKAQEAEMQQLIIKLRSGSQVQGELTLEELAIFEATIGRQPSQAEMQRLAATADLALRQPVGAELTLEVSQPQSAIPVDQASLPESGGSVTTETTVEPQSPSVPDSAPTPPLATTNPALPPTEELVQESP